MDGQGKIKMYHGMSRVEKQLSGKRSIIVLEDNVQVHVHIFQDCISKVYKYMGCQKLLNV